jgi:hypothetical protein
MLAELSTDSPSQFSTPFSRDTGLEPSIGTGIFLDDALALFIAGLNGALD